MSQKWELVQITGLFNFKRLLVGTKSQCLNQMRGFNCIKRELRGHGEFGYWMRGTPKTSLYWVVRPL